MQLQLHVHVFQTLELRLLMKKHLQSARAWQQLRCIKYCLLQLLNAHKWQASMQLLVVGRDIQQKGPTNSSRNGLITAKQCLVGSGSFLSGLYCRCLTVCQNCVCMLRFKRLQLSFHHWFYAWSASITAVQTTRR